MSTIHFHQTTTSTPEQFVAGLTDFGPGRSKVFAKSADSYLKVHHRGLHDADVTEGSGGVWERLQYDWSDPNRVGPKTMDSNVFGGALGLQIHPDAAAQRNDRRRCRHRSRGQEHQGTCSLGVARNRRQRILTKGIRQQRQGHRGPHRRERSGQLVEALHLQNLWCQRLSGRSGRRALDRRPSNPRCSEGRCASVYSGCMWGQRRSIREKGDTHDRRQ